MGRIVLIIPMFPLPRRRPGPDFMASLTIFVTRACSPFSSASFSAAPFLETQPPDLPSVHEKDFALSRRCFEDHAFIIDVLRNGDAVEGVVLPNIVHFVLIGPGFPKQSLDVGNRLGGGERE